MMKLDFLSVFGFYRGEVGDVVAQPNNGTQKMIDALPKRRVDRDLKVFRNLDEASGLCGTIHSPRKRTVEWRLRDLTQPHQKVVDVSFAGAVGANEHAD